MREGRNAKGNWRIKEKESGKERREVCGNECKKIRGRDF
jgi:hypothetical protein